MHPIVEHELYNRWTQCGRKIFTYLMNLFKKRRNGFVLQWKLMQGMNVHMGWIFRLIFIAKYKFGIYSCAEYRIRNKVIGNTKIIGTLLGAGIFFKCGLGIEYSPFNFSNGWLDNFKKNRLKSSKSHRERLDAHVEGAAALLPTLRDIVVKFGAENLWNSGQSAFYDRHERTTTISLALFEGKKAQKTPRHDSVLSQCQHNGAYGSFYY